MPHTRDEISDEQGPSSAAFEPRMHACKPGGSEMEDPSVLHEHVCIEDPAQGITERDAAGAAKKCCGQCRNEGQCAVENEISREREKPLIRHRQAGNPKHE